MCTETFFMHSFTGIEILLLATFLLYFLYFLLEGSFILFCLFFPLTYDPISVSYFKNEQMCVGV